MELETILKREIKALAFDLYGTVVDIQSGLAEIAAPFLADKGWDGDAHRFVTWWRRTHFENSMIDALCDRGHTPYRQIGHRAVSYVMDRCGIAYTRQEVEWLVSRIETLKPFAGIVEALERLRSAGYKLVSRYPNQVRHRLCPVSPWESNTITSRLKRDAVCAA